MHPDITFRRAEQKDTGLILQFIKELAAYEKCVSLTANPHILSRMKAHGFSEHIFDRLAFLCPHRYIFKGESFRRGSEKNFFDDIQVCKDG